MNNQQTISFQALDKGCDNTIMSSAIMDGKLDMMKMRESVAHWILMHEHPFSVVEDEGFNMMQQRGMPQWEKFSRVTSKKDCMLVYENEKKKLFSLLKNVNKISLTIDMWLSSPQKMEYMVLTGHFIDNNLKLQKRVLNFVHLPPPLRGIDIADSVYKCCKEWGIENKVCTISVDNATKNDVAIRNLKDTFSRHKKLLCGGKIFHVRCTAHILNIMVQYGLEKIERIIKDIRDSVVHIKHSEKRLIMFAEIAQQLQLHHKKLVIDCKTRWNSPYDMLFTALQFKEVFPRYKDRDSTYECCPSNEDWEKASKVCEILEVFSSITNIISGSEYPTSNLFLNEVYRVKVLLDRKYQESIDKDYFIFDMVANMKIKFDKYWGECNLLMAIGAILDPRCKMRVIEFCFPKMYTPHEAHAYILDVKNCLYELYSEYVAEFQSNDCENSAENLTIIGPSCATTISGQNSSSGWSEFSEFVKTVETISSQKSDLDIYLEEGCYIYEGGSSKFDALEWWKANTLKYRILSKMAKDVLAIPITTVASEATLSAGGRIIDSYRASLAPETVQALICGGDWLRCLFGIKKKSKKESKAEEVVLPINEC
ncbi:zinc finger BED domain-containing protein RICESLEEPER 2-like [Dioscorea cayenensis subsp. rotundata]|uniref:Zinc finger BED domain-containing protein RICESLEEPER 2-like n=1 Tax=Dioscorea cayennensis subsp. rotundata TaxID=55577 RepID=A0AB40CJM2_DIOCR|nr:zinc finger BED domain-containing protein RICESLEEPER 2-like [Dioscorea cayenensis subsp. rotundata]